MLVLNALFRLFGYEWVEDKSPAEKDNDIIRGIDDEDWDDLDATTPRYILRKVASKNKAE